MPDRGFFGTNLANSCRQTVLGVGWLERFEATNARPSQAIAPSNFRVRISQTAFVIRLAPESCFHALQTASMMSMLFGYSAVSSAVHCAMLMKLVM
jgi:hypothetical protein